MTQTESTLPPNKFPQLNRHITDNDSNGIAVFSPLVDPQIPFKQLPGDACFALTYTTSSFPSNLSTTADIESYKSHLSPGSGPGISIPGGSVLRYVDMPPGLTSPMHRTASLDYGVVLEGEVELILDSGEKRLMKRGDVSIQRATMHAWRNTSETEWSRMLYVLLDAEEVVRNGKKLSDDYGGIPGHEEPKRD